MGAAVAEGLDRRLAALRSVKVISLDFECLRSAYADQILERFDSFHNHVIAERGKALGYLDEPGNAGLWLFDKDAAVDLDPMKGSRHGEAHRVFVRL